jgi:hypothetical protein
VACDGVSAHVLASGHVCPSVSVEWCRASGCRGVAFVGASQMFRMLTLCFVLLLMIDPRLYGVGVGTAQLGMAIQVWVPDTRRVPDPMGTGTATIFYPRVAPVPEPNRDGYGTGIFSTRG